MKNGRFSHVILLFVASATSGGIACAQSGASQVIYKYVDPSGRVTYANSPIKGGVRVELDPLTIMPSAPNPSTAPVTPGLQKTAGSSAASARLASMETTTQRRRDEIAPRLLAEQIDTETRLLKDARAQLAAEQESSDTIATLHIEQYQERVRNLQDEIAKRQESLDRLRAQQARNSP
jgi:hypothetical protein